MNIYQVTPEPQLKKEFVNLYYDTLLWKPNQEKFSTLFTEHFQTKSDYPDERETKASMIKRFAEKHFNTFVRANIESTMEENPIKLNDDGTCSAHYVYTAEHDFSGKKLHAKLEHRDIFSFEISNGVIKINMIDSQVSCEPLDYTKEQLQALREKIQ